mmetsp:Transcript_2692/g.4971  ORF Transcript_2692/g.4971 Transcript_2692/m.4971 type:complete len:98 (+) Transcript_2692:210-503(+)
MLQIGCGNHSIFHLEVVASASQTLSSSSIIADIDPNDTFPSITITRIIIFTPCRRFHRHYLSSLNYDYTAVGSKSRVTSNVDRPAYISIKNNKSVAR